MVTRGIANPTNGTKEPRNRLRGFKFMVGGTGLEPVNLSHVKRAL